ncbi:MAG: EscU/YscU/HrcU family type III secretion system export apparatus switch protein [Rhodoplanes sp.]|nr:EscU/YscU/HrcU family type III secretion system export apparatus switch protein [Rhodoplanes sp.]
MTDRPAIPLAIALHYEAPGAPRVVAKGKGAIGEKIIETARANGVPIEENAGLAAALSSVELGDEIPEELYRAVAEVLTFILRLSGRLPAKPATPAAGPGHGGRQPAAASARAAGSGKTG